MVPGMLHAFSYEISLSIGELSQSFVGKEEWAELEPIWWQPYVQSLKSIFKTTCSTGWRRNGELRKHRVVLCVAGVLVYSQYVLILHCLFPPRPLQLVMILPHTHHLSGRTEVGTMGMGSFHYQWLRQWGTFGSEPHLFYSGAMDWGCVQLSAEMVTKVRISLIHYCSNNFELFCRPGGNGLKAVYKKMCLTPDA